VSFSLESFPKSYVRGWADATRALVRWADGFDAVDDESSALADFDGPGTDLAQAIEAHQHLEAGQRALILTDSDGLRSSSSCAAQRSSTMRGTCASMSKPTRSSIARRAGWIRPLRVDGTSAAEEACGRNARRCSVRVSLGRSS
jgi:hypothetical protein